MPNHEIDLQDYVFMEALEGASVWTREELNQVRRSFQRLAAKLQAEEDLDEGTFCEYVAALVRRLNELVDNGLEMTALCEESIFADVTFLAESLGLDVDPEEALIDREW